MRRDSLSLSTSALREFVRLRLIRFVLRKLSFPDNSAITTIEVSMPPHPLSPMSATILGGVKTTQTFCVGSRRRWLALSEILGYYYYFTKILLRFFVRKFIAFFLSFEPFLYNLIFFFCFGFVIF